MERPEFREEWEARPVQFAPTISAVPPTSEEEVNSQAVTRGQKRKQEEEGIVRKGSGKTKNLDYINLLSDSDMEADGELSDYEEFVGSGMKDKGKRKEDDGMEKEGQKQGGNEDTEKEQEKETDVDDEYKPHLEDDTVRLGRLLRTLCGQYKIL